MLFKFDFKMNKLRKHLIKCVGNCSLEKSCVLKLSFWMENRSANSLETQVLVLASSYLTTIFNKNVKN